MSKLNKYANLYDLEGNLIRHVNEKGVLPKYTTEELEELVDRLSNDKDDSGKVKNPQALNNVYSILMQYYQKYGNPHEKELFDRIKTATNKTTEEQVTEALNTVMNDLNGDATIDGEVNEYAEIVEEPEYIEAA